MALTITWEVKLWGVGDHSLFPFPLKCVLENCVYEYVCMERVNNSFTNVWERKQILLTYLHYVYWWEHGFWSFASVYAYLGGRDIHKPSLMTFFVGDGDRSCDGVQISSFTWMLGKCELEVNDSSSFYACDNLSLECIWEGNCTGGQLLHLFSFLCIWGVVNNLCPLMPSGINKSLTCTCVGIIVREGANSEPPYVHMYGLYGSDGTAH